MLPVIPIGVKIATALLGASIVLFSSLPNDNYIMLNNTKIEYKIVFLDENNKETKEKEKINSVKIIYKKDKNGSVTLVYDHNGDGSIDQTDKEIVDKILDEASKTNGITSRITGKAKDLIINIKNDFKQGNFIGWRKK